MKYLIFFVALIFSFSIQQGRSAPGRASIVTTDTVPNGLPQLFAGKYYQFKGYVLIDSLLLMPCADTNFIPNKPAIVYKCSDSTFYLWSLTRWRGIFRKGDPVPYGDLTGAPPIAPGPYVAPGASVNPAFLVFASGIARPSNSFSHGTPITWEFLTTSTAHNYSFFDSVYGHPSTSRLVVRYPNVKTVFNVTITPDETFAINITTMGSTVGLNNFETPVYRTIASGIRLTGAGTTTWTKNSGLNIGAIFDVSTYSNADGGTSFNVNNSYGVDYNGLNIQYIGANDYHIRRQYSGLGIYSAKFIVVDAFNNPVLTSPTTSDEIIISNAGMNMQQIGMTTWSAATNSWMGSTTNFWIYGAFEAWLVAAPINSSSIQVRWQTNYPSATNYKIYRSTSLYGTYTLIHTGTGGITTDSGLSANTLYYYKMVAVVGGVDTDVTTFRTNTYP